MSHNRQLERIVWTSLLAILLVGSLPAQQLSESCQAELRDLPLQPPSRLPPPPPVDCTKTDDLVQAASYDCVSEVREFLEAGVSPDWRAEDGRTALAAAAHWGQARAVRMLLDEGADPMQTYAGQSVLCWGARSTAVTRLLLERGLLDKLEDSCAYLEAYSASGKADVVRELIAAGLDIEKRNRGGDTALVSSAIHNNYPVLRALLEAGANPDATGWGDSRVPMLKVGNSVVTCLLLRYGADPNRRDARGETSLMSAAEVGDDRKARLLSENGANPDLQDSQGRTPLMHALTGALQLQHSFVSARSKDVVAKLLIKAGADVSIQDKRGRDALAYAEKNGHRELAVLLSELMQ